MNTIEKLKEEINKIETTIKEYTKFFMGDDEISEEKKTQFNQLNETIAKIKTKITDRKEKAIEDLKKLANEYTLLYASLSEKIEKKEVLNAAEEKQLDQLDKTLQRFLKKYAKQDSDTQEELLEQKDKLNELNETILQFKADVLPSAKDLSDQESNPAVTRSSKKYITEYKDLSTRSINAITQLFQKGKVGEVDAGVEIHHNDVEQGYLGDCYFLAAIGAVAHSNPAAIRDLITPKGDGTYDVKLYVKDKKFLNWTGLEPVTINVTSEIPTKANGEPIYAQEGDNELWVVLVEKAYAKLNGNKYKSKYKKIEGGFGTWGIEAVTGKQATAFNPKRKTKQELINIIQTALEDHRPVTVGTKFKINKKKNWVLADSTEIISLHEYYVLEINDSIIKLQNPHNVDSDKHYYYQGGSEFELSIDDFIKYYAKVSLQI